VTKPTVLKMEQTTPTETQTTNITKRTIYYIY